MAEEDRHKRNPVTGQFERKHKPEEDRMYATWCSMKERCQNPNNKRYTRYAGRGIKVCDEWKNDFSAFAAWAWANGYADGLTIDRIDNDGNYEPGNCRWVTSAIQNRNYSRNHMLTYKGETLCLSDMADKYGINRATLLFRLKQGKTIEEALSPIDGRSLRWQKK